MSNVNPIIWMNVTTSANWQRAPVGIVRVERSLSTELAELYGERFRFCVWQDDQFVEWKPENVKKNTNDVCGSISKDKPTLSPIFPILPKRKALIALGQSLLSLMPSKLQPYFNRLLHFMRPQIVRIISNNRLKRILAKLNVGAVRSKLSTPVVAQDSSNSGELFSPGDVLISLGLDWDYPYYKQFYTFRKQNGLKIVTCCYDLIPIIYPQYCVNDVANQFTSYFLDLADGSDLVLCISRQSQKDLNEMLDSSGGAKPQTHVIPLGDNVPTTRNEEISPAVKSISQKPFILFVSTIERRKNHEILYRAYHLLCSQGKQESLPKLVFVGMQGWGVSELMKDIELDPQTRDFIIRLNQVSDAELRVLYEAATFCVFPSLYEGWGLPVGEALSLGKAILCSNRGSLPEVGGDLVRYVDPWNPNAWAEEIHRMSTDEAWREHWEFKAKDLYSTRTWSDTAISVKESIHQYLDS